MEQPHNHPIEESQRILRFGIALTAVIFLLEFVGGLWTHSLALISDAWHVFIDLWALVISFLAIWMARRPATDRRTFGFHRMEVMAATINGTSVFFIALGILYAAWRRYHHPVVVDRWPMLWLATVGLVLNLVVARLFYRHSKTDLNMRGAFLHLVGDAVNTLAVILAALAMIWTGSNRIDPVVSGLIAIVVLVGAGRLLRESFNTLLEGVPPGIRVRAVEDALRRVEGVRSVHDLHVWSICSHLNALSGHVLLSADQVSRQHDVLETIGQTLKEEFGIAHTTIQVEFQGWPHGEQIDHVEHG